MRTLVLCAVLGASSCVGRGGPALPPNVGTDHPDREERPATPASVVEATPVEVGTPVWANHRDTGFYFHGVVVDRREALHHVLYSDGASEWVTAGALLPDSLGEEAVVHVRTSFGEDFHSGIVARRAGQALYVRMSSGDERWTTLPHVRFRAGEPGAPARGDTPSATSATAPVGADVLVNYQYQGLRFPGVVTARTDEGRVHVVYLDGESEWAHAATTAADDAGPGTVVHVRRSWEPPVWVRGRIQRRVHGAVAVELDDGGLAWTSMLRVRVPVDESTSPGPRPTPAPAPEPAATPSARPRRR